jgi:hypothetical protein
VAVYLVVLTVVTLIALAFGPETRDRDIVTTAGAPDGSA